MIKQIGFGDYDVFPEWEDSKIVILPVAFDGTSTGQKGADKGPQSILEVSNQLEWFDIETRSEVYYHGIYTDKPIVTKSSVDMIKKVREKISHTLNHHKFPVLIGGEHSVSIGAIQAANTFYSDLSVLQLDAHADLRDQYQGSTFNHACVMARAKECCEIVQVGIRSADIAEIKKMEPEKTFWAHEIHDHQGWIDEVPSQLKKNVYVTIDLDVFDPSIMPSTGTPEPGGLLWYQVLKLLKTIAKNKTIIGFDVVELCPNASNKAPDYLAAKLIYKLLSYIWE